MRISIIQIIKRISFLILFLFYQNAFSAPVDLFESIGYEDEAELRKAIKAGGNVNQISPEKEISILMASIETMKPNLVKLLLDSKANPNLKIPANGKTALMHFMTKYNMNSEERENGVYSYSDTNEGIEIFNLLIKAGAKATEKDKEGKSVLAYVLDSSSAGRSEAIINTLLEKKADPNQNFSNDISKPICLVAAEDTSGNQRLALNFFLKRKGCDPNKQYVGRNQYTTTLLHIVATNKDRDLIETLLVAGANPDKGASDSMMDYMPIFNVITDIELLELMLKFKANPNSIENQIHILEHAARNVADDETGERIINLLLSKGTEINHPKLFDSYMNENKAVYAAQIVSHIRIEKFLVKKGALKSNELKSKDSKKKK